MRWLARISPTFQSQPTIHRNNGNPQQLVVNNDGVFCCFFWWYVTVCIQSNCHPAVPGSLIQTRKAPTPATEKCKVQQHSLLRNMIILVVTGILRNFPTDRHESLSLSLIQLHNNKEHCLSEHPYPTDTAKVNIYCTQALKNRVTSKRFVRFRKNPRCIAG